MILAELCALLTPNWEEERVPQDFKDGDIITLYKKDGQFTFSNYRGITMLATVGKLFTRVILNRIWLCINKHLPEAQGSF